MFERAVRHDAAAAPLHAQLGRARTRLREWDAAVAAYEAALRLDDRPAEWHAALAFALAKQGRWNAAIRAYEAALARDGANPDWHVRLGKARGRVGDWGGAADAFRAAGVRDRDNPRWGVLEWRAREHAAKHARGSEDRPDAEAARQARGRIRAARRDFKKLQGDRLTRDPAASELDRRLVATHPGRLPIRRRITQMVAGSIERIRADAETPRERLRDLDENQVFVFWAQGAHAAPPIVQLCQRELRRQHRPGDITLLDSASVHDLVEMPRAAAERIGDDWTRFSDLLRLELLSRYGGIWVDATCLPLAPLTAMTALRAPSGFFAFTARRHRLATWFLMSEPQNYLVALLREGLYEYWRNHDRLVDYFVVHHVFEALCLVDERFAASWSETPTISRRPATEFRRAMTEPYDPFQFAALLDDCFVHKLTYKYDPQSISDESMLAALLRDGPGRAAHRRRLGGTP